MSIRGGEAALAVVREVLEGFLEPRRAGVVVFEALAEAGRSDLPESQEEVVEFVRGPLRTVASRWMGEAHADLLVDRTLAILDRGRASQPEPGGSLQTIQMMVSEGPLRALVVSRGPALAVRLRAALGGERFGAGVVDRIERLDSMADVVHPHVVVLDGPDPVRTDVETLVEALARLPVETVRVSWGSGAEFSWIEDVQRRLEERGVTLVTIDRREGVEPLLDLLRALARKP
ncbi:MAG: hypothetical protein NZ898_10850 [Myxococcota bacterium]|nr:hypothetical protein [Myxococcota bacterium]MDW8363428.1 hypothetical protein [Myxococcales bacterium]